MAANRLDRLDEEHALLQVAKGQRRGILDGRERLAQSRPEPGALAVLVYVEATALEPAGPVELVEHAGDDALRGMRRPGAALGLDRVLGGLGDLAHQLHVELV